MKKDMWKHKCLRNDSNQYRRSALWKIIKKARRFRQITIQILPMKSVYIMLVLLHIPEPQNYTNSDLGTIREKPNRHSDSLISGLVGNSGFNQLGRPKPFLALRNPYFWQMKGHMPEYGCNRTKTD